MRAEVNFSTCKYLSLHTHISKSHYAGNRKRGQELFLLCQLSTHQSISWIPLMRRELLGVIPVRRSVRRYCSSGMHLLDVSHVWDRKKLENITRGYSDRCSYASPRQVCGRKVASTSCLSHSIHEWFHLNASRDTGDDNLPALHFSCVPHVPHFSCVPHVPYILTLLDHRTLIP